MEGSPIIVGNNYFPEFSASLTVHIFETKLQIETRATNEARTELVT